MKLLRFLQLTILTIAAAAALAPLPADLVERHFADGVYPPMQAVLTSWSNQTGVALFDFVVVTLVIVGVVLLIRSVKAARRTRSIRPLIGGAGHVLTLTAIAYLWFVGAWGLNYARPPLESTVSYDASRVTPAGVRTLAERAAEEVNRLYEAGHAAGFPAGDEIPPTLVRAMREVEHRFGRPIATTPGRPKRTLFGGFFRAAGVDGMHAPFLLETMLNPDLTPPERPAVLAHEWAHLAGYAPEADASFVGLLAALRADPGSQYSAWLVLFDEAATQLPRAEQRELVARLGPGPRADRQAIAERQRSRVEVISRASWKTYDRYLKAQGVSDGVESYSRVVQLLLGTGALDW